MRYTWTDRVFLGLLLSIIIALLVFLAGFLVDAVWFERASFADRVACEARRMEARRQTLSSNVVCVPAYRATKNDTLTVDAKVGK